jgi:hypothetical protein
MFYQVFSGIHVNLSYIRFLVGFIYGLGSIRSYMNPTKNLIEPKFYMNPNKNLIKPKPYMNPTKNLIEPKPYMNPNKKIHVNLSYIRFLVGFM